MAMDPENRDVRYASPLQGLDVEARGEPIELRPVNIIHGKEPHIDLSGYYDKQEVDMQLRGKADKSDLVTKADKVELVKFAETKDVKDKIDAVKKTLEAEIGAKIGSKLELKDLKNYPNKAEVREQFDSYYKKSDVDALLTEKLSFKDIDKWYIKPEMDSLLSRKANKDTVYTKDELDSKFDDIKDSYYYKSVIDSKIEAVMNSVCTAKYVQDNLVNYYTKYDVNYRLEHIYNKNETDEIVNNINNKIDENTNQLIENINLVNDRFINYYTKAQVDQLLKDAETNFKEGIKKVSDKLNESNVKFSNDIKVVNGKIDSNVNTINTKIGAEVKNINTKIDNEVKKINQDITAYKTKTDKEIADINNKFNNYYNKTESKNLLDGKADLTTVYNKNEIDNKISNLTSTIDSKTQEVTEKCNTLNNTINTKTAEFDQKIDAAVTKVKSEIDVYTKAEMDDKLAHNNLPDVVKKSDLDQLIKDATKNIRANILQTILPAGAILGFAFNQAKPKGFILCDGRTLSKKVFPELFNAIQYTYGGSGDNFNVPDLRGKFLRGAGGNASSIGSTQAFAQQNILGTWDADNASDSAVASGAVSGSVKTSGNYKHTSDTKGSIVTYTIDASKQSGFNVSNEVRPINMAVEWHISTGSMQDPIIVELIENITKKVNGLMSATPVYMFIDKLEDRDFSESTNIIKSGKLIKDGPGLRPNTTAGVELELPGTNEFTVFAEFYLNKNATSFVDFIKTDKTEGGFKLKTDGTNVTIYSSAGGCSVSDALKNAPSQGDWLEIRAAVSMGSSFSYVIAGMNNSNPYLHQHGIASSGPYSKVTLLPGVPLDKVRIKNVLIVPKYHNFGTFNMSNWPL